jgi:LacI family transcriptional regulator
MTHITQSDIARKLNVSRITVSKALRNHPDISSQMKKKINEMAEELGYTPNLIAKNLTSNKMFTIGVVIPDLENSFFAYATDSIIDTATEKKYNVFVTVSREHEQNEILNLKNLVGMRVDGLLVCISQQTNDISIFDRIKNLNIPLIFFDRHFEGLNFRNVVFDDKNGAISALDEIIENGYSKIAHFAGYSNVSIGKQRCMGYKYSLEKNGINLNPDWILEGGFEVEDGYEAFMRLYRRNNLPEIIFTVNDRVALGVYQAARETGINIPEDIGLLAYGFNETAQIFTPTLSVINQNPRKIGKAAAEMLIEEIENNCIDKKQQIIIEEEFLWNDSIIRKIFL